MLSDSRKDHQKSIPMLFGFFLLAVVVAPFLFFPVIWDFENLPKQVWIQFWAGVLLIFFLVEQARNQTFRFHWDPLIAPVLVFFVWISLSFLWTGNRYEAFIQWLHWGACIVFYLLGTQILDSSRKRHLLITGIALSGVVLATFGMAQFIFEVDWIRQQNIPAITFNNKNMANQYIVLVLPTILYLLLIQKNIWTSWSLLPALAVVLVFPLYTTTRASQVATFTILAGFLLITVNWNRSKRAQVHFPLHKATILILAAILALFLSNITAIGWQWRTDDIVGRYSTIITNNKSASKKEKSEKDPIGEVKSSNYLGGSASLRLHWYKNTGRLIMLHPITGVGMRNFYFHYPKVCKGIRKDLSLKLFRQPQYAHSDFLQIGSELGIPIYFILLWFFWSLVKRAWRMHRRELAISGESQHCILVSLLAIIGLAINALFSFPIYRAVPPFYGAVFLAILVSASAREVGGQESKSDQSTKYQSLLLYFSKWKFDKFLSALIHPKGLWGWCIAAGFLFIFWFYGQTRIIQADYYFRYQNRALREKKMAQVIPWGEPAQKANPWRVDIAQFLANGYQSEKRHQEAEHLLGDIVERCPYSLSAQYYHALALFNLDRLDEANDKLQDILKILPNDAMCHNLLGHIRIKQGLLPEAYHYFRATVKKSTQNTGFWRDYAHVSMQLEKWREAALGYSNWTLLDPQSADAHYRLGILYATHLRRPGQAKRRLEKGIKLDSQHLLATQAKALLNALETQKKVGADH